MTASKQSSLQGFTLIELMITVAVIAILSAVALPSYTKYVQKSRRADAKTALLELATRQERYYSLNNAYTSDPVKLGYGASATFPVAVNVSGQSNYQIDFTKDGAGVSNVSARAFEAKATPIGNQTKDTDCYAFVINQLGVRTNVKSDGTTSIPASAGCW